MEISIVENATTLGPVETTIITVETVGVGPQGPGIDPVANQTLVGNVSGATAIPVGLNKPAVKSLLGFIEASDMQAALDEDHVWTAQQSFADFYLLDNGTSTYKAVDIFNGTIRVNGTAIGGGPLTVTEVDGIPSVTATTIKFPNGSVTDNGSGVVTIGITASMVGAPSGSGTSSGTNTGDETTATIKTKLGITTLSGSNTGDQDLTTYALKTYVDSAVVGLYDHKGPLDCSANPNYPTGLKGDAYNITVAGKIGGASGKSVDVGDLLICSTDNAGGTEASVGTSWFVVEHNLVGALVASNNLSDLASASTARTNLGLGSLATQSGTFSGTHSGTSSGTNTGDQTTVSGNAGTATALATARTIDGVSFDGTSSILVIAPATVAATSKATPIDADVIPIADSAASNVLKKLTWANLKATVKTYFDTLYSAVGGPYNGTLGATTPASVAATTVAATSFKCTADSAFASGDGPKFYRSSTLGTVLQAYNTSDSNFTVISAAGSRIIENPTGTNHLLLQSGGSASVHIGGTATPTERLQVTGNILTSGTVTTTANGAASTPPVLLTGTWFTGGTATTTKPQLLIEPTGTTSTGWNTAGTAIGANAASGFTGNLIDLQRASTSKFFINWDGLQTTNISQTGVYAATFKKNGTNIWQMAGDDGSVQASGQYNCPGFNVTAFGGFVGIANLTQLLFQNSGVIQQRNAANAQTYELYGTYTDASNYRRLKLSSTTAGAFSITSEGLGTGASGNTLAIVGCNAINSQADLITNIASGSDAVFQSNGTETFRVKSGTQGIISVNEIAISTAGKGLKLKSGTGARAGNATLVAGTVTVTNTTVTANTIIYLTRKTSGGTIGTSITYTLSAGASFTINSDNPLDTSVFSYILVEVN